MPTRPVFKTNSRPLNSRPQQSGAHHSAAPGSWPTSLHVQRRRQPDQLLARTFPDAEYSAAFPVNDRHLKSANFPLDAEGRTYHVGTKIGDTFPFHDLHTVPIQSGEIGEVANRVLAVGSVGRAHMLAAKLLTPLEGHKEVGIVESSRGFLTATGMYRGTAVSIVTHLMGFANIDLMLRETLAVSSAPMLVVRIGTCGSLNGKVGQLMVATQGSVSILRDPDAFHPDAVNGSSRAPYRITRPVAPDAALSAALLQEASNLLGSERVVAGLNASADSFFSSQGRLDDHFDDRNEHVIDMLIEQHPAACSLEMEAFHLFHLAECSKGSIRGAAAAISLADRLTDEFIDTSLIPELELLAGTAALNALVSTDVVPEHMVDVEKSVHVWAD